MKNAALILGSYLNAYDVMHELNSNNIICVLGYYKRTHPAYYSNIPKIKFQIPSKSSDLLEELQRLSGDYENLIVYPTDDNLNRIINSIAKYIPNNVILPFKKGDINRLEFKETQYKLCEKLNIPYPKTIHISNKSDIRLIQNIDLPLIIKPNSRIDSVHSDIPRNIICSTPNELQLAQKYLLSAISITEFIASEFIPGSTTDSIFAYTGFYSFKLNKVIGWCGKKLSQFPDDQGVFASATLLKNDIVKEYGEKLITEIKEDYDGIAEPEFKFDCRDNKYKLMEINFRTMMWHGTARVNDIHLCTAYFHSCLGKISESEDIINYDWAKKSKKIYTYFNHEIINLIFNSGYKKTFVNNTLNSKTRFAFFNKKDIIPFLYTVTFQLFKMILIRTYEIYFKKN